MAKTNWYVITGGPCSGKTTAIELLEKKGYKVQKEAARIYFDKKLALGRKIEEIRKDEGQVQKEILRLKEKIEKSLPKEETIFLDRAIPDSFAYYEAAGLSPKDKYLLSLVKKAHYKKIFLFELLEYKRDDVRTDSKNAKKIEDSLEKYYLQTGFEVVRVPDMGKPEKRIEFITANL